MRYCKVEVLKGAGPGYLPYRVVRKWPKTNVQTMAFLTIPQPVKVQSHKGPESETKRIVSHIDEGWSRLIHWMSGRKVGRSWALLFSVKTPTPLIFFGDRLV